MSRYIAAALLALVACSASSRKPQRRALPQCDLFLAPLKTQRENGFRTGVYAGRHFRRAELIEIAPSVIMKSAMIELWQLYDYSFETESKEYEMHLFGAPMMLAHREEGNVYHFWTSDETSEVPLTPPNPYTDYDTVSFYSRTDIARGEELILSNGDPDIDLDAEDESLGVEYGEDDFAPYTIEELHRVGHCMSNVYVAESDISQAGQGLFTRNFVKKDEIVTISAMMVLPRHKVEKQNPNSLLINYCISRNNSDMALLPVGLAGMINHNNGIDGDVANLRMEWHSWDSPGGRSKVKWEPAPLEAAEFPPLYIKYVATRDIYAGEELTISYGSEWEEAWKEYDEVTRSLECSADEEKGGSTGMSQVPQFRHYITAPDGFFPRNFESTCIGKNKNDCALLEAKRRMSYDDVLQEKYDKGPQLAAAYREKIYNKERDTSTQQKVCQRSKKEMPLVYSELNPPDVKSDEL